VCVSRRLLIDVRSLEKLGFLNNVCVYMCACACGCVRAQSVWTVSGEEGDGEEGEHKTEAQEERIAPLLTSRRRMM
jgi:hypothetical protein